MSILRPFRFLLISFTIVVCSSFVDAQATRTWVSGVGDDVNPCSRTAPCKTFAGAISKTATNGEINCLDPAGFGAVTITKSITIDCEDTQGSILASLTNGVIINITNAADTRKSVNIRGISINGAGNGLNGIRILAANSVTVDQVVIDGFANNGIVSQLTAESKLVVSNSLIRNNVQAALNLPGGPAFSMNAFVLNTVISGNGTGISPERGSVTRISGVSVVGNTNGIGTPVGNGQVISYRNNLIDGNGTNGAPTSNLPLQ